MRRRRGGSETGELSSNEDERLLHTFSDISYIPPVSKQIRLTGLEDVCESVYLPRRRCDQGGCCTHAIPSHLSHLPHTLITFLTCIH